MELAALTLPAAPRLHFWTSPVGSIYDDLWRWEMAAPGKRASRLIRGAHCWSAPEFFAECAAALQFPPHFGNNWDAFADCFRDWRRWGDSTAIVLCFLDGDRMLAGASETRTALSEILAEVLKTSNDAKKPRPFHVVLHSAKGGVAGLKKSWPELVPLLADPSPRKSQNSLPSPIALPR